MAVERKLKIALNDNRLLILGTQVLFGFQFNGIFQDMFAKLPLLSRALSCSGLTLLMLAIGLLIAPSMFHRIVEGGDDTPAVMTVVTVSGGFALMPFAVALAFDMYIALGQFASQIPAIVVGAAFFLIAMLSWFVLGLALQRKSFAMEKPKEPTPLSAKVDQLLTEARLIIPGVQALFGFQLSITLTKAFEQLPDDAKAVHIVALCCMAVAIVLVMAPASLHRISFGGEDDPLFVRIGSMLVIAAPVPLAFGIGFDTYVATLRALDSRGIAALLGAFALIVLFGIWYVWPIGRRLLRGPTQPAASSR